MRGFDTLIDTLFPKYYEEIVNYEFSNHDIFSYKIIDWYKELVFTNLTNIDKLDEAIYLYISDYKYRRKLTKLININDIRVDNYKLIDKMVVFTLNYIQTNKLEKEATRWL